MTCIIIHEPALLQEPGPVTSSSPRKRASPSRSSRSRHVSSRGALASYMLHATCYMLAAAAAAAARGTGPSASAPGHEHSPRRRWWGRRRWCRPGSPPGSGGTPAAGSGKPFWTDWQLPALGWHVTVIKAQRGAFRRSVVRSGARGTEQHGTSSGIKTCASYSTCSSQRETQAGQ